MMTFTLPPDHLEVTFKKKIFAPSSHKVLKKKRKGSSATANKLWHLDINWKDLRNLLTLCFQVQGSLLFQKKLGKSQLYKNAQKKFILGPRISFLP